MIMRGKTIPVESADKPFNEKHHRERSQDMEKERRERVAGCHPHSRQEKSDTNIAKRVDQASLDRELVVLECLVIIDFHSVPSNSLLIHSS